MHDGGHVHVDYGHVSYIVHISAQKCSTKAKIFHVFFKAVVVISPCKLNTGYTEC